MQSNQLLLLAGKKAYQTIKENGLQADQVNIIAGAAGGPKWIVLQAIDKFLFGHWFKGRKKPLYLLGSSIGSWRFLSALAYEDPIQGLQQFKDIYFNQPLDPKETPANISASIRQSMRPLVNEKTINHMLNHPYGHLHFFTILAKGWFGSENKRKQQWGMVGAVLANLIHRSYLGSWAQRVVFEDVRDPKRLYDDREFGTVHAPLTTDNFIDALMASSAIPSVLEGVKDIAHGPKGNYRDGGITDYHMTLPFQAQEEEVILLPHFYKEVKPGWFDKFLPFRKPKADSIQNVLMVCPSDAFIAQLPGGKVTDRKDFIQLTNQERLERWEGVYQQVEVLGEELAHLLESGEIKERVQLWDP